MPDPTPRPDARPDACPNRLAQEKSPYLLQHAFNPVDWVPWGEEAFARARAEDRPIFLSIGYATCHWCHVMERESFEDADVAALLNRDFVSIKVDREERPDIDGVYMTACQLMTGQGGWPLTIVMTPDKQPFFAGTYFPREGVAGRAGMLDLLPRLAALWRERREDVEAAGAAALAAIREVEVRGVGPGRVGVRVRSTRRRCAAASPNCWPASTRTRAGSPGLPSFRPRTNSSSSCAGATAPATGAAWRWWRRRSSP